MFTFGREQIISFEFYQKGGNYFYQWSPLEMYLHISVEFREGKQLFLRDLPLRCNYDV